MGMMVGIVFLVLKVCAIAGSLILQESSGHKISPSPANFSAVDPIVEGSPHRVTQEEQMIRNSPSPTSQPNPSPHFESASAPQAAIGHEPSSSPITPLSEPPHAKARVIPPDAAVPVVSPPSTLPRNSPQSPTATIPPSSLPAPYVHNAPSPDSSYESTPPTKSHTPPYLSPLYPPPPVPKSKPRHYAPLLTNPAPSVHNAPPPDSSYESTPPTKSHPPPSLSPLYPPTPGPKSKPRHYDYAPPPPNPGSAVPPFYTSVSPAISPSTSSPPVRTTMPVASHPSKLPQAIHHNSSTPPSILHEPHVSPVSTPLPSIDRGRDVVPVSSSLNRTINITPTQHTPAKAQYVHKAPSSYNHTHHLAMSTPPTISHPPPSLLLLYPAPPPRSKSKPRHYAPPTPNSVPPSNTSVSPAISPSTTSARVRTTMPLASTPTAPPRDLPLPYPTLAESPSNLPVPVASPPSKLPKKFQPIHHNSSIPPSILPEPHVSPVSTPLPSINSGRDIVPVSSSRSRTINITPTQHTPMKAPSVHNAPSSYNHTPHLDSGSAVPPFQTIVSPAISPSPSTQTTSEKSPSVDNAPPPDSSYMSTPPTKSRTPPLLPLYPPPPGPKSKPRHYAPPPQNPAPSVHNAPPPDSSFKLSPPTESHPAPSLSPLFSPSPGPMSKPRHYAPPPPNKGLTVPPFHTAASPAISPSATSRSVQTTTPSAHNAPSSYNHAPPSDSSYKYTPPTKSHIPPSLSPLYPPRPGPKSKPRHYVPPPPNPAPSVHNARPPDSDFESTPPAKSHPPPSLSPLYHPPPPGSALPPFHTSVSPAISPSATSVQTTMPFLPPKISPLWSPPKVPKPIQALPPPPPNADCSLVTCKEPLTNTPPGMPCNCVMPMQIELSLGVALYTFFPLVSELAFEIASGVYMKSSQVRIMGANADDQDPEKTVVLIDLVPFGEKFDDFTAHLTAQRLWLKQVSIKSSLFRDYEVLYVKYPGLPPSPPLPSSTIGTNGESDDHDNNGMTRKPLGVDVGKHRHGHKLNGGIIAIIILSAAVAAVLFSVLVWVLLFKRRDRSQLEPTLPAALPAFTKSSGIAASRKQPITSMACTGSAKTFSLSDMEKATNNFNESQVLGEGGFGLVYSGLLDDGMRVAVKVLKRVDKQGGREFLAEVEMLSRLHHRNLVRLIGFCTDDRNRCLVYELIPNGSVQSHLHGKDKETSPLDWVARLKIALGAARGLAYLHEDSSPRVIHRDFKSSNILLEHDFTPKVSDFGLARSALDEENKHITTRIMGTFGYLAPEYAMTGHLLVKSDVYSYGVVLLELLTGRKPVDMSMPPGQENLVAWAQPLLMAPEGLPLLIDPMLFPDAPFDSIAKVAAVASMCVQTDVSHRPFMGEVVQALKLVCTECEEPTDLGSTLVDFDARVSPAQPTYSDHESPLDLESGCSMLGLGPDSGSYRMSSSSGPLTTERRLA